MKSKFFIFFCAALFLTSCDKEVRYSCDDEIDEWVKENYEEIQTFSRDEIASYSRSYQVSILGAINPERKKSLWNEKVRHINILAWSEEEKEEIISITELWHQIDYTRSELQKNIDVNEKLISIIETCMGNFNWSEEFVYQVFFTIGDVETDRTDEFLTDPPVDQGGGSGDKPKCNCRYSLGCAWSQKCHDISCKTTSDCGVFGNSDCTGVCSGDY